MTKLCPVVVDTTTNQKYAVVYGKLLNAQEALEQEIYFGYIDVAPIPQTGLISQMQVLYTNLTLSPTGEMELVVLPEEEEVKEVPEELLAEALTQATEEAKEFTITLTGGTNE